MPPIKSAKEGSSSSYGTLGVVTASHAVTHMQQALMPLLYPFIMAHFGLTYGDVGLMTGVGRAVGNVAQGAHGLTVRRFFRRTLLGSGNILLGASILAMALSGTFSMFFAFSVLAQLAKSPQHPIGTSLVADVFGRKLRGTALAVDFAGGNLGMVLVPIVGVLVVSAVGWRVTLGGFAALPVIMGVLCLVVIPRGQKSRSPELEGKASWLTHAGEAVSSLRDRNILFLTMTGAIAAGGRGMGVMMVYLPLYLNRDLGLEGSIYGGLYTTLLVGSVGGPLIIGYISDRIDRKSTLLATYIISAGVVVSLTAVGSSVYPLAMLIVLIGIFVYSQSSLVRTLVVDAASDEDREMALGAYFLVSYMGGAGWAVALGYWIDAFGFASAFTLMALLYVAAAVALLPVRLKQQYGV